MREETLRKKERKRNKRERERERVCVYERGRER